MITHLTGTLLKKSPTEIVIEVGGVGYMVHVSVSTFGNLPDINSPLTILTYHHIREDAQLLFGFMSEQERDVFRLLLSVSGIGPKMAQTILSGIQPNELISTITQGNVGMLTSVPGVGKKTAERMIVELKDRVTKIPGDDTKSGVPSSSQSVRSEALTALVSLGFSRDKAEQSIRVVLNQANEKELSVEDLIKNALKQSGT